MYIERKRWYEVMKERIIWEVYQEKLNQYWNSEVVNCEPKYKGKLKGAIVANLVAEKITEVIDQSKYKVSENNVFILGYGTEFDLLILKKEALPIEKGYLIYKAEDVKAIIECKATGLFFDSKKDNNPLKKELETFKDIKMNRKINLNFGYITMQEQIPIRSGSIDFLQKTDEWINKYVEQDKQGKAVYCVANNRTGKNFDLYTNKYSFEEWIEYLLD